MNTHDRLQRHCGLRTDAGTSSAGGLPGGKTVNGAQDSGHGESDPEAGRRGSTKRTEPVLRSKAAQIQSTNKRVKNHNCRPSAVEFAPPQAAAVSRQPTDDIVFLREMSSARYVSN